ALHCGRSDIIRVVVPGGRPSAVRDTARRTRSRLRPLDVSGRRLRSRRGASRYPATGTSSKKNKIIDEDGGEKTPAGCTQRKPKSGPAPKGARTPGLIERFGPRRAFRCIALRSMRPTTAKVGARPA